MALETAQYISQLDAANPSGPDRLAQGDDHIRLIKQTLKATFPNINGPVTVTEELINAIAGMGSLSIPVGSMVLWYGTAAAVPAGYALCDGRKANRSDGSGQITTPDMRGRVPQGAQDDAALGTKFGQDSKTVTSETAGGHSHAARTGAGEGSHSHTLTIDGHTLTIDEIPAHTHTLAGYQQESLDRPGLAGAGGNLTTQPETGSVGGSQPHSHGGSIGGSGAHDHTVTVDGVAAHAHAVTVDVTQASIALHYIMKV